MRTTTRRRRTAEERAAMEQDAFERATCSQAMTNLPVIYAEFIARGIPEHEILPRENVFTFNAWRALGRHVKRGEHGVRIITWIPMEHTDPRTHEKTITRRPSSAYVFHISQTEPNI